MSIELWKNAILEGDVDKVRSLMVDNPDLANRVNDQVFSFDRSAVFACRENLEMVDLLLKYGADLNQKTGWGAGGFGILEDVSADVAEPLIDRGAKVDIWAAVSLNRIAGTRQLLADDPRLILARGGDGKHPLHYARTVEMVDVLVNAGADVNARDVDHTSTPLQYLIENEPVVRRLLKHGADADVFAAAALGDLGLLTTRLGSNPDEANDRLGTGQWSGSIYNWKLGHDLTPLDVARERGHADVLRKLLETCSVERQLTDALWNDERDRVDQLVNEHPALMADLSQDARELLASAVWWYRPPTVQKMLELGFDPHVTGAHESTPLDRAAFHGYADMVAMLLTHDPDPPLEARNEFGGTPVATCIYGFNHGWTTGHPQDHFETIRLLLDAGAPRPSKTGLTGDERINALLEGHL